MKHFKHLLIAIIVMIGCCSCKKFVAVDPPASSESEKNVFNNDASAIAVMTSVYTSISTPGIFTGGTGISLLAGLSADELDLYSGIADRAYLAYYTNDLIAEKNYGTEYWDAAYRNIYVCNALLEGVNKSTTLTPGVKQQLLGEAKFTRAFLYFYLVNLYGDVPLATTTDYTINSKLSRTAKEKVYQQIIEDLTAAKELLSESYVDGTLLNASAERIRPNKWAAAALLSRVYLYMQDWSNAEAEATSVINNVGQYNLSSLSNAFLKADLGNNEAIWQIQPVMTGHNTEDAWFFVINAVPGDSKPVHLSNSLLDAFESGDARATDWVGDTVINSITYSYPFKYKYATLNDPVNEFLMVLRLSEIYLIRAEARAQQDNIDGSRSDLDVIRTRAELSGTTAIDKTSLLSAILHERQVELFTEWGHRWLDLKRTGNIDVVMNVVTPLKSPGSSWQSYQQLYPLLFGDILSNPNLSQNPGY